MGLPSQHITDSIWEAEARVGNWYTLGMDNKINVLWFPVWVQDFLFFQHTLQLWGPCNLLLNGSGVGVGGNALITHFHLLPRSSMSETTQPLCHVPSCCRHIRFYLYLNLTSFSLCISVNAKHTHHNPLLAILVEWWCLINWLGSTNRPVGVWHNWCFEGSRTCPQCSILVRLHVWCHMLQRCKAITCTM